jgi:hypothetical protein
MVVSNVFRKFFHPRFYRHDKVLASLTESLTIATSFGLRVISCPRKRIRSCRRKKPALCPHSGRSHDGQYNWGLRSMQDDPQSDPCGGQNVFDVYTKSTGVGLNCTKYRTGDPYDCAIDADGRFRGTARSDHEKTHGLANSFAGVAILIYAASPEIEHKSQA